MSFAGVDLVDLVKAKKVTEVPISWKGSDSSSARLCFELARSPRSDALETPLVGADSRTRSYWSPRRMLAKVKGRSARATPGRTRPSGFGGETEAKDRMIVARVER